MGSQTLKMSFKVTSTMQSSSAAFNQGRTLSGKVRSNIWLEASVPDKGPQSPALGMDEEVV